MICDTTALAVIIGETVVTVVIYDTIVLGVIFEEAVMVCDTSCSCFGDTIASGVISGELLLISLYKYCLHQGKS